MSFTTMIVTMGADMLRTIGIFVLTLLGALPLGMVIMFGRKSKHKIVSAVIKGFISVIRGTPLMLQLLVWYFGPYYLFGWSIKGYRYTAIIIGFVVNYACYFAEIYRGGIEAMDRGQYEAAEILGYTKRQTFFRISSDNASSSAERDMASRCLTKPRTSSASSSGSSKRDI